MKLEIGFESGGGDRTASLDDPSFANIDASSGGEETSWGKETSERFWRSRGRPSLGILEITDVTREGLDVR